MQIVSDGPAYSFGSTIESLRAIFLPGMAFQKGWSAPLRILPERNQRQNRAKT
jgi:hypothetical protein